jgi:glycosyltransferase involved in cell wall biosynthesis
MQALALQRLGHRVTLLVSPFGPAADRAGNAGLERVTAGNPWCFLARTARARPDAICAHRGEDQAAAAFLLPGTFLARARNDQRKASGGPAWRFVDRRTSIVVFPSPFMARRGYQGGRKGPVTVVPFPVDTERFIPSDGSREKLVVSLGRLSPVKGHRTLIAAMAEMPGDWKAVIAGGEDQQTREELAAFAREKGVGDRISLPGVQDDVRPLLASASMGVVTSLGSEMVSRAGLEMMSCGLPLLAAATNGLCDMVRDGVTGLLHSPGNHRQLASQMRFLADNPAAGDYLGTAARRYVCQVHSLTAAGRAWEHILEGGRITRERHHGKAPI